MCIDIRATVSFWKKNCSRFLYRKLFYLLLHLPWLLTQCNSSSAVGTYGDKRAKLYELNITQTELSGTILDTDEHEEKEAEHDYSLLMQGWFHFIQTEDGSIPSVRHSREEDKEIVNTKKAMVSAFQANFMGTKVKEESDPQSLHMARYT